MSYLKIPNDVTVNEVLNKNHSLSASRHKKLLLPNKNFRLVREFLTRPLSRKDLGTEVGSVNYISQSTHYFIRTRALQSYYMIPDITNETAMPIMPKSFVDLKLKKGDVVLSKDSNIGEIVILDKDYPNYMLSGALYKLPLKEFKYYLLAFIKHPFFREQLDFIVPKSSIIRHAKTLFLDCKIPLPNKKPEESIQYVEQLTQSLINKEIAIKERHQKIMAVIENELVNNQKKDSFQYEYPTLKNLMDAGRIDAGYHSLNHKKLIFPVLNYKHGYSSLDNQGLKLIPGPSLEIKLLGTRIDSNTEMEGFYRLITPKQITNFGVVTNYDFIGTPRKIKSIRYGDILFGESGTGRSMVFLDNHKKTINNAHAHILRPQNCSIEKSVTIRCILQYYKEIGIIDHLTVGGSGGHLSPSYFDRVAIPNFPENKQIEISALYHNAMAAHKSPDINLNNFSFLDKQFDEDAGIIQLDKMAKKLKNKIDRTLDSIINDKEVEINFDFVNE